MSGITIRTRILASFLAILAVLSAIAAINLYGFLVTEREGVRVETQTVPALSSSLRLATAWVEAHRLLDSYVLQADQAGRDQVLRRIEDNRRIIAELMAAYEATIETEVEERTFAGIRQLSERLIPAEDAILQRDPSQIVAAVRTELGPQFDQLQAQLAAALEHEQAEASQSVATIVSTVRQAELALTIGFVVALALSILCGYLLFRAVAIPLGKLQRFVGVLRGGDFSERLNLEGRDEFGVLADGFNSMADDLATLIGQVQRSSIQVNTSITEVAATSKEQQATASEIAATTTEIGATAKEISATSNELVRTMAEVSGVAEQTATLAGGGQSGLSRMEDTMRRVMEAAGAINTKLSVLSEKAGDINQMVTTITKVADQTNLLSLNAAIEAEKAGQYGRGFAVVATEIRRLADQTAASTYDIEQMVKDIQSAVAAGVMGMDKFSEEVRRGILDVQDVGGQLSQIIHQVQGLVPRFDVVNEGMQAQATGAEQISDALGQLSEAAQQTVESLHQSSVAMDELNQVSSGLRNSISRFKLRA
ncbi:methyl-accepting chemotaxis protein [Ancylobacter sp. A5.8]|uniref:methyl-accepting chemotaxis protein n=1 Tax=Ancylobacter gelatini TaxID=2919920 RepID=UPI001F4DB265|nr:methyl-accepting chemotaxis protein [Ancylobacter gelatini]MCJ8141845.1 methyl-accepting chemotaxis protein [Ancylobacter gelatini]